MVFDRMIRPLQNLELFEENKKQNRLWQIVDSILKEVILQVKPLNDAKLQIDGLPSFIVSLLKKKKKRKKEKPVVSHVTG